MTKTPTSVSEPTRELNPHVRFCAEQFGFKIEWRVFEVNGEVYESHTKWYITRDQDYGCSFWWTEDEGVEEFFNAVRNYFYESGQESCSGW